jgi:hypothetical protein
VTLAEARALLEISADATEIEIRRAYLRKIRTCKPEIDPEGFKRLRSAHDIASGGSAHAPSDAAEREPLAATEAETPDLAVELLHTLLRDGPVPVAPAIVRLVESAIAEGRVGEIPFELVVHFGLASFAAGRRKRAGALVIKWFAAASHEGVIGPAASHDFVLMGVVELARLPRVTPVEFVQTMANGFLTQEFDVACGRLIELVREQPVDGEALRFHVFGDAPVLRLHYGRALRGQGLLSKVTHFFQDHPRLDAALFTIVVVGAGLIKMCRE